MLSNLQQMHLKLVQIEKFKKQLKQFVICLAIKWLLNYKNVKKFRTEFSKTVTNENDKEIPKERYISPEGGQKTIDDLRLI